MNTSIRACCCKLLLAAKYEVRRSLSRHQPRHAPQVALGSLMMTVAGRERLGMEALRPAGVRRKHLLSLKTMVIPRAATM